MQETGNPDPRTRIPSVNQLAEAFAAEFPEPAPPHALLVRLARRAAELLREAPETPVDAAFLRRIAQPLLAPGPRPVVNATGILLHTNLGRAPLPARWIEEALARVAGYTDLELTLENGKRGKRDRHFAELASLVWGAPDATLVNNAAAAVALALAALGGGRETVVSRGELIEIGGSFRLPDIMALAGTRLVEVGTTNKTKITDYARALGPDVGCLLKTHTSNYKIQGFTAEVPLAQLAALGRERGVPVVMDLGSGLSSAAAFPPVGEPFIEDYLAAGPDLLLFSGDKLFGGIQAGIVLGSREAVGRLRAHPMMRMLRLDKLSIAVLCTQLAGTVMGRMHPLSRLACMGLDAMQQRARRLADGLPAHLQAEVVAEQAYMGGGSLPQETRDTWCVTLKPAQPEAFARRLRTGMPAVMGYLRRDTVFLNLGSVFPEQDAALLGALLAAADV